MTFDDPNGDPSHDESDLTKRSRFGSDRLATVRGLVVNSWSLTAPRSLRSDRAAINDTVFTVAIWKEERMTKRLLELTAAGCVAAFLVGCGGGDSTTSTTSNDDIAAFIEENPEYGDSAPAAGKASESSAPTPLGLER